MIMAMSIGNMKYHMNFRKKLIKKSRIN